MLYKRQIIDSLIKYLYIDEVLVLHGARQVGKTHILYWLEKYLTENNHSCLYLDLEDSRNVKVLDAGVEEFIRLLLEHSLELNPDKKSFVFIDEIQYLKNPSEFLKLIADHHKNIKLIVSGSSSFAIKSKFKDSLVGRTINFEIYNLSFAEYLIFQNQKPVNFENSTQRKLDELLRSYKTYVLYGGYPKIALTQDLEIKEKRLQQIIDTYIKKDVRELANIDDWEAFNRLLEILASQSGQMLNYNELANTCRIAKQTVKKYLFILEETYIIKLVKPYHTNLRSEISKTPKIFFYDTGLMQMLWLKSLQKEIIGNVFETSIFVELIKKYGKDKVYYWRTKDKKEIDFIVRNKNEILALEVKMNSYSTKKANLSYFSAKYKKATPKIVSLNPQPDENHLYPWQI